MTIDFTRPMRNWKGEEVTETKIIGHDKEGQPITETKPVPMGRIIADHVASTKIMPEKAFRLTILANQIYEGGKRAEMASEDIAMVVKAIKASDLHPWAKSHAIYLMDRQSVDDKEFLALADKQYGRANGKPNGKSKGK